MKDKLSNIMKYISLFSGIGGFEHAIHQIFPNATCLGFSDVKQKAIDVYKLHFPEHPALGDISKISDEKLEAAKRKDRLDSSWISLHKLDLVSYDKRGISRVGRLEVWFIF